jgi:predicted ABC-type ATPase
MKLVTAAIIWDGEDIRRRFKAGLTNFHERYSQVADSWAFYDNSGLQPRLNNWSENES